MTGFGIALLVLALVAAVYLALLCPYRGKRRPVIQGGFYAHRGLHDLTAGIPENSLPAFERAAAAGYGAELDVRLSADGQVVVFHDDTLTRACGREDAVETLSLDELGRVSLFGTEQAIPTFRRVLEALGGAPLIVEIKPAKNRAELCEKTCALLEGYPGFYCLESFDPRVLLWLKKHKPHLLRGQLSSNFFRSPGPLSWATALVLSNMLTNAFTRPDFIAYHYKDRYDLPLSLCQSLFRVPTVAWTLDSPQALEACRDDFSGWIFEHFTP
jgi:glycerophosphoryl diester phosphodiesterase